VGRAVEELGGAAPVVVGEACRLEEVEPPGDVRRRREFVDGVLGRPGRERPESVRVGGRRVGDEHPDVDAQVGRPSHSAATSARSSRSPEPDPLIVDTVRRERT